MALGPAKSNTTESDTTKKNIDVWNTISNNIEDKPEPPKVPKIKIMSEDSMEPIPGSNNYSAKDALKDSRQVTEIYNKNELDEVIDNCMEHIKNEARQGSTYTGIDTGSFNAGLTSAILKEFKRRGFKITKDPSEQDGYIIDWSPRKFTVTLLHIFGALLLGAIIVFTGVAYAKSHQPVNVEQSR